MELGDDGVKLPPPQLARKLVRNLVEDFHSDNHDCRNTYMASLLLQEAMYTTTDNTESIEDIVISEMLPHVDTVLTCDTYCSGTRMYWMQAISSALQGVSMHILAEFTKRARDTTLFGYTRRMALGFFQGKAAHDEHKHEWMAWISFYLQLRLGEETVADPSANFYPKTRHDRQAIFWGTECMYKYCAAPSRGIATFEASMSMILNTMTYIVHDLMEHDGMMNEAVRAYRGIRWVSANTSPEVARTSRSLLESFSKEQEAHLMAHGERMANAVALTILEEEEKKTRVVSKSKKWKMRRKEKARLAAASKRKPWLDLSEDEEEIHIEEESDKIGYFREEECVMCLDAEPAVLFEGCKHMVCCHACVRTLRATFGSAASCPCCRGRI